MTALLFVTLFLLGDSGAAEVRQPYGPALEDYRAAAKDFRMLEAAIVGALRVAPKLFPEGIGGVDIIMQDTSEFFIYSRNSAYPYPKVKRWRQYQVYRLPHRRPREHEMWGCAGGPPSEMEVEDRRIVAEYSIRCAPWGAFRRAYPERSRARFDDEGGLRPVLRTEGREGVIPGSLSPHGCRSRKTPSVEKRWTPRGARAGRRHA